MKDQSCLRLHAHSSTVTHVNGNWREALYGCSPYGSMHGRVEVGVSLVLAPPETLRGGASQMDVLIQAKV